MARVFHDVACTVCGCVCDDLRITVEDGRITQADGTCHLSTEWFLEQGKQQPPAAEIDGRPVAVETAIRHSVEVLSRARYPLIYGLSRSSTAGQRAAVRLADKLGANVDTTASLCHAPSIMAIQEAGESTCTLGEVRNRADLVIFWRVDPARSHPRHGERYSIEPAGMFLPRETPARSVVVVDEQRTETSELASVFLPVEAGKDFEALWTLRCLVRGVRPEPSRSPGIAFESLQDLALRMRSCRYGIIFFGLGLARMESGHRNVEALLRLVTDLNAHTRFHARRMRVPGDVTGADNVLCWQTGFPFSVNLSRGYPRYSPGEYSAQDILARGEADACVLVGSESIPEMSAKAVSHLECIPTIVLDHPSVPSSIRPTVRFTTAVYGIHLPGTAYRMDEVPIPLRPVLATSYASDADILQRICGSLSDP